MITTNRPSEERFREIAEQAISYLQDNNLLLDFLYDRDIDLSGTEADYFDVDYDEIDMS